jgi:formate hydrogenlyase subunit 4
MLHDVINTFVHLGLLLAMPPLLPGLINKTKAFFAGRKGPPLLQPYFDIYKLLRKGMVISSTTTWIFQAAPVVTLAATLLAGMLVPFGPFAAPVAFTGDLILFVYLFGLARFFTTSAALDTGSSFEGMGAAREVTFACLSEAAVLLGLLVLVRLSGSFSLTPMLLAPLAHRPEAPVLLAAAGLFVVLLAENARIPVDDPNTHLELTMIHEVMVLDHSGPLLGLINYGSAIKLFVLSALVLHLLVPFQIGIPMADWVLFILEMIAMAGVIGTVESFMARLQMRHVPTLLAAASLLCGFGFVLMVR